MLTSKKVDILLERGMLVLIKINVKQMHYTVMILTLIRGQKLEKNSAKRRPVHLSQPWLHSRVTWEAFLKC